MIFFSVQCSAQNTKFLTQIILIMFLEFQNGDTLISSTLHYLLGILKTQIFIYFDANAMERNHLSILLPYVCDNFWPVFTISCYVFRSCFSVQTSSKLCSPRIFWKFLKVQKQINFCVFQQIIC